MVVAVGLTCFSGTIDTMLCVINVPAGIESFIGMHRVYMQRKLLKIEQDLSTLNVLLSDWLL